MSPFTHYATAIARILAFCASLCLITPAHAALNVVATTSDLAALVAEVGGDGVSVKSLSRADENPHYVDPRPSLVVDLARGPAGDQRPRAGGRVASSSSGERA